MQLVLLDSPQIVDNEVIDHDVNDDNLNQEDQHEQINQLGKVFY